ncbi:MAG: hypothetical protein M1335_07270 [Chloroflexi bacterium]|nr:hypothetical protein [Chloroflexota bacterium]
MAKKTKKASSKYTIKRERVAVKIDPAQLAREAIILERNGEPFGAVVSIEDYRAYDEWKKQQVTEDDFPPEWHEGKDAFQRLLPELLKTYREKFVAIYKGRVVDSDGEEGELMYRVALKYGDTPVYIDEVLEKPRVYSVPSVWHRIT